MPIRVLLWLKEAELWLLGVVAMNRPDFFYLVGTSHFAKWCLCNVFHLHGCTTRNSGLDPLAPIPLRNGLFVWANLGSVDATIDDDKDAAVFISSDLRHGPNSVAAQSWLGKSSTFSDHLVKRN